jgi:hypothetical protein
MIKKTEMMTFGLAAALLLTAGTAFAACPRSGGGYGGSYYNQGHNGGYSGSHDHRYFRSGIFEIVDKTDCDTDACTSLVLRDANGADVTVSAVEYDESFVETASLDELNYHLSQNGSAVRGHLEYAGDVDGVATYSFIVEQIYS